MDTQFTPVRSVDALDRLVKHSADHPIALFKHDTQCSISAAAYQEMSQLDHDVAIVDVGRDNDLAQEVARRTGIKHESPQVIVFDDGKPIWSASHYDITADAVDEALHGR